MSPMEKGGMDKHLVIGIKAITIIAILFLGSILAAAPPALGQTIAATIPLTTPSGVGVNPITNTIYVANQNTNQITVIDSATNNIVTTISVDPAPYGVDVNPITNRVYVSHVGSGNVIVINGATNMVEDIVNVGPSSLRDLAVNPVTNKIYVNHISSPSEVSVIDGTLGSPTENTVVATILASGNLQGAAVNPNTNRVYITTGNTNLVHVIDGGSNTLLPDIFLAGGADATSVDVNPITNTIYTADYHLAQVSVINGNTNSVTATIPVGNNPHWVSVNPTTNTVFVANEADDTVSVINGNTNSVTATIPVADFPYQMGVNENTNKAYVSSILGNTFSVIQETPPVCTTPPPNLISWWPGDGNANDIADANPGTLVNGATFATGFVTSGSGQAFSLDGTDDFVRIPDSPNLTPPSSSITIDAWVNPDTLTPSSDFASTRTIISKFEGTFDVAQDSWAFQMRENGKLSFGVLDAIPTQAPGQPIDFRSATTDNPVLTVGVWQHVAATFDHTQAAQPIMIYVNGVEVPSMLVPGSSLIDAIFDSNTAVRIGALVGEGTPGGVPEGTGLAVGFWDGLIDEVEIYDRALTQLEIQAISNAGSSGKCKVTEGLTLVSSTFFGGPGDQGQPADRPVGLHEFGHGGIDVANPVYITGATDVNFGDGIIASYSKSLGSPLWSDAFTAGAPVCPSGKPCSDGFTDVTVSGSDVFASGFSEAVTSDCSGGKEAKGIIVKYLAAGTSPTTVFKAINGNFNDLFTSYCGAEALLALEAADTNSDGSDDTIFATGFGQPGGCCGAFILTSWNPVTGDLIGKATDSHNGVFFNFNGIFSKTGNERASVGNDLTILDGKIYSAGLSNYDDQVFRPAIWKHDFSLTPLGKVVDTTITPVQFDPTTLFAGDFHGITNFGGDLYAVGRALTGVNQPVQRDFLIQKYNPTDLSLIWSRTSGGSNEDVLLGVIGFGDRIYAVGYTKSSGNGGADGVILQIDPGTGDTLSTTLFGGAQEDFFKAVDIGSDLYVTGESRSFATADGNLVGQNDLVLVRYTLGAAPSDTTPPDTTITSNPSDPTSSTDATFEFTGTDDVTAAASLTFECKLDASAFAACTSPKTYSALAEGSHTFQVRAIDAASNVDPSPASFSWTVDTTRPVITLLGANPQNLIVGDAYVELEATVTDNSGESISPIIDSSAVDTFTAGTYAVTYDASDSSGNAATQVERTVQVFTDIITSNPGANVNVGPGDIVTVSGGATVTGNIKNDGGTIIVQAGSNIIGNIETKNGGTITIDGTSVSGNVDGGDGPISITGGSTVSGSVKSNGGTITIDGSSVNGNVDGNGSPISITGGSTVSGNVNSDGSASVVITDSTIGNNVQVKNAQDVTITRNTINGNLEINNTSGNCDDTNNSVTGNTTPCP